MHWKASIAPDISEFSRCVYIFARMLFVLIPASVLPVAFSFAFFGPLAAMAQAGPDLQPGHYAYLGSDGKDPPKHFTIDSQGSIHWQNTGDQPNSKGANKGGRGLLAKLAGQSEEDDGGDWTKHEFPFIEWKGYPIPSIPQAVGFISTTAMPGHEKGRVIVKYSIQVQISSAAGGLSQDLNYEFRDKNGFGLFQATVPAYTFHLLPQTSAQTTLFESTGQWPSISDDDYKKARHYVIR